jgi:2-oxoglutarate ferredoxin oxidoreductase subunit alpha
MPTRTQQTDITACAYASHGDTKHVLLMPEDPSECFEFAALAFDLADRLQTPIFVMLDLEIGMNERLTKPFSWVDSRRMDRGKVMTAEDLEAGKVFGRYLDVDDDGITYRTLPGTHPTKGAFFTRGTSKNRMARYSEEGADYEENMERLLKKHRTARTLVPAAIEQKAQEPTRYGAIYFGSTTPAMIEADMMLTDQGIHLDLLRVRGFPFGDEVAAVIEALDRVFVVEQNRDGQLRSLLVNELEIDPKRLAKVVHYDGTPISARFISGAITEHMERAERIEKAVS